MKMSAIQERRARGLAVQPRKPSHLPAVAGTIAAFVGGAILVMATGAIKLPAFPTALRAQAVPAGGAGPVTTFATDRPRLGHAASAPLLRQCLPYALLGLDDDSRLPVGDAYALLKSGSRATGLAAVAGLKKDAIGDSAAVFSAAWGEIADCVYRQNGGALCDADNRALAVESTNAFVKQAATVKTSSSDIFEEVKAEPRRRRGDPTPSAQRMQATKERVLGALRARVEQGYLIAVDFGMFAPREVNTVLTRAQTRKNSCAERR
ncbi:MAG: hypothetical protein AB7K35_08995 [Pseudorhodoplanes sp.]